MVRTVLVLVALAMFVTSSIGLASAQEITGTYLLVRDSDGQTPKNNATVTITFRGGKTGTLAVSAVQPRETVTDNGRYGIIGNRITMQFDEMEWGAQSKPFSLVGCTLTLPFRAFGGAGTSTWTKQSCSTPQITTRSSAAPNKGTNANANAPDPKAPAAIPAAEPQPEPVISGRCKCQDGDYLKRRLNVVSRALNTDMELALAYEKRGSGGKPVPYTEKEALDAESRVQWAIDNADELNSKFQPTPPGASGSAANYGKSKPRPAAWTNGGNCAMTIKNANTCQNAVLESHERIHKFECDQYHSKSPLPAPWGAMAPGHYSDYKTAKTMADFLKEEVRAYEAEQRYIENELRMLKQCREWFCDDGLSYETAEECERSCRAGLGRNIMPLGHRCKKIAK
jgi:hypothetical protein